MTPSRRCRICRHYYLLLTTHYALLTTDYSLLTTYYLLFARLTLELERGSYGSIHTPRRTRITTTAPPTALP